jgi:hypothetical protein
MNFRLWSSKMALLPALEAELRQSRHVLATAQGDELVLLDMKRERYYTLNEVGSRTWALLALGATRSAIVETICNEYQIDSAGGKKVVNEDIARLLSELYEAGLIVEDVDARPDQPMDAPPIPPRPHSAPRIAR